MAGELSSPALLFVPSALRPQPSAQLRPVRDAPVVLAGVALRAALPSRPVGAIGLVRLGVHGLLRRLAQVTGGFADAVFRLLRRLLRSMAHVACGCAEVM